MPQAVRGVLPSERCSSLGSRAPLEARLLPCGRPSQYLGCDARGRVLWVSPHSPGLRLVRLGSPQSSDVVSGELAPVFPDALDPVHRDHPVPAASSASKPSSPRESVLTSAGCPATASRCSPGLPPLQSLRPTRASGPRLTRRTIPSVAELARALTRGATPRQEVRSLRPHGRVDLVGAGACRATARPRVPPLGGNPASLDLGSQAL